MISNNKLKAKRGLIKLQFVTNIAKPMIRKPNEDSEKKIKFLLIFDQKERLKMREIKNSNKNRPKKKREYLPTEINIH